MVRINAAQGRALRSLAKGAGAQPMPQDGSPPLVGKPVYLYVTQKFPERQINPVHPTSHALLTQLATLANDQINLTD